MSTTGWIIVGAVIVIAAIIGLLLAARAAAGRRRAHLQDRFGPEYDRAVEAAPSRHSAEEDLLEREKAHDELELTPLSDAARTRFTTEWEDVQRRFVDDPETAASQAERLVRRVMTERGYPAENTDSTQLANTISVDHPDVVSRYREGRESLETRSGSNDDRTEALRRAMIDFRSVFETLLQPQQELSRTR